MAELIHKSVRLPSYLIDMIKSSPGKTFSEQLIGILEEDYRGAELRQQLIQEQTDRLEVLHKQISNYYDLIYKTRQASYAYEKLLKQLNDDIDRLNLPFT